MIEDTIGLPVHPGVPLVGEFPLELTLPQGKFTFTLLRTTPRDACPFHLHYTYAPAEWVKHPTWHARTLNSAPGDYVASQVLELLRNILCRHPRTLRQFVARHLALQGISLQMQTDFWAAGRAAAIDYLGCGIAQYFQLVELVQTPRNQWQEHHALASQALLDPVALAVLADLEEERNIGLAYPGQARLLWEVLKDIMECHGLLQQT